MESDTGVRELFWSDTAGGGEILAFSERHMVN